MAVPVTIVDKRGVPTTIIDLNGQPVNFGDFVEKSTIDQPNGVAGLDASGKVSTAQMPVGDVTYQGNWNASTNTPTLANGVGTQGDLHICDVAGTQDLGGGSVAYGVGDWLIYDGTAWDRVAGHGPAPANPSVTAGLTAKNGTAATFMRSDAAPAIDQTIAPTWTGAHTFSQPMTTAAITASGLFTVGASAVTAPPPSTGVHAFATSATNVPVLALSDGQHTANSRIAFLQYDTQYNLNIGFANDAFSSFTYALQLQGGNGFGMTGIQSNSGSGQWLHSGEFQVNGNFIAQTYNGNGINLAGAASGSSPTLTTMGVNPDVGLEITTKGAGAIVISRDTNVTGTLSVNGAPVVGVVASDARLAQSANVNAPTAYAVPASGTYRVSTFIVLTQAATTSATLPTVSVTYTESATGVPVSDLVTNSAAINQVGAHVGGSVVIQAQQGSSIGYTTSNYASSGATSMQYDVRIVIERLL